MASDKRLKLTRDLFNKMFELKKKKETNIKVYEIAYQDVIKVVYPDKCWWEVTECQIFTHLMRYKDPEKTAIEILNQLKED